MCFVSGDPAQAEAVAIEYATVRNLAQLVAPPPIPVGGVITVTTIAKVPTFLAGVIGFPEITVGATAVAACGAATSACGLSPIAFNQSVWDDIACDEKFYVWNENPENPNAAKPQDCNTDPPDLSGDFKYMIGQSQRGWVLFPRPESPYPDEYSCADNCGVKQLTCVVKNGYDGKISTSLEGSGSVCIPGQPGVAQAVNIEINKKVPYQSNVLLWDRMCENADDDGDGTSDVVGTCPGDWYHITGLGCVEILQATTIAACGKKNLRVIEARKSCDCTSTCGRTDGTLPKPGDVKAVNILK